MNLSDLFLEFIETLNKHDVEYLMIGGQAVIQHGYLRYTKDIDFLVNTSRTNLTKMMDAVSEFFGTPINPDVLEEVLKDDDSFFKFGVEPNRIDILKSTKGIVFQDAYSKRIILDIAGTSVNLIDIDTLIENKKAVGRSRDLIDAEQLEKIKKHPKK